MTTCVLLVDDEPHVLRGLTRTLWDAQPDWVVSTAAGADDALARMREVAVDVVVTDINMPGKDGLALLSQLQESAETKDIPVIILTGREDTDIKRRALELGAMDLLNKPVHPLDLVARLRSALRLKTYQDQLRDQNAILERKIAERTADLADSRLDIIWRLSKAGEHRDEQTGNHVVRVGCYCRVIGEALDLDREFVEMLFLASPLHDIGKIGIPDAVLLKPGKLDPDEWAVMKRHCAIGAEILREESKATRVYRTSYGLARGEHSTEKQSPILELASSIALNHHERWDGAGYPAGLSEQQIPLAARIVTLADTYDALRSERPYKAALSEAETLSILRDEYGRQLDPSVWIAFSRVTRDFEDIRKELSDPPRRPVATGCPS